jgi:hypothetical protein
MQPRRIIQGHQVAGRDNPILEPLIVCPDCKTEMRLFGIEAESPVRDAFTFECVSCGRIEGRGALVAAPYSPNPGTA